MSDPTPDDYRHVAHNLENYQPPRPRDIPRAVKALHAAADEIVRLRAENERLMEDMDQVTGWLAGVGTVATEEEALAGINNLPSVQEAWNRNLTGEVQP